MHLQNLVHFLVPKLFINYRQEVDGTYILEMHKDEKKGEAKATIVMDFCSEVVRVCWHQHRFDL